MQAAVRADAGRRAGRNDRGGIHLLDDGGPVQAGACQQVVPLQHGRVDETGRGEPYAARGRPGDGIGPRVLPGDGRGLQALAGDDDRHAQVDHLHALGAHVVAVQIGMAGVIGVDGQRQRGGVELARGDVQDQFRVLAQIAQIELPVPRDASGIKADPLGGQPVVRAARQLAQARVQ